MKLIAFLLVSLVACTQGADLGIAAQSALTAGLAIPATTGTAGQGVTSTTDSNGNVLWKGGNWDIPLPLSFGDAEGSITVTVQDNGPTSADPSNVIAVLESQTSTGLAPLCSASSNGSGSVQMLTLCAHTVANGESLLLRMEPLAGGALPHLPTIMSMVGMVQIVPLGPSLRFRPMPAVTAVQDFPAQPSGKFIGGTWFFTGGNFIDYPVPVNIGETLDGFTWWANKSNPSSILLAQLVVNDSTTGTADTIAPSTKFTPNGATGRIVLTVSGLGIVALRQKTYILRVEEGNSTPDGTTAFTDAELSYR